MECPQIPRMTYGEFRGRLNESTAYPRIPWSGSIELTARCNLRCVHCYIACDLDDPAAQRQELGSAEWRHILDEIVDEGCLHVLPTGGEPLIRPDFLDIYMYAKNKGLIVTLFTNGTMITPEIADVLAEYPPRGVEITLYGAYENTYETVTRVPASYKRCIRGIELLLDRGLPLSLKTMLMTLNKHELRAMEDFAARLGVKFRHDGSLNFRLDGDSGPARFRLSPEEIVELDRADERRMREIRRFVEEFGGPPPVPEMRYYCGAGQNVFHIDSCGRLSVCVLSREPQYDLCTGSFRDGWEVAIPGILARLRKNETPCGTCALSAMCDQCPGWGTLEWNDPEKPVDFVCRIARLRHEALGLTPPIGAER